MTIQELQIKYANGEISSQEYTKLINELRNPVTEEKSSNVIYYLFGIGLIGFFLLRKKL